MAIHSKRMGKLIVCLLLSSISIFISGCVTGQTEGTDIKGGVPVSFAIEIWDSDTSVGSEDDVKRIFSQSSTEIFSSTIETIAADPVAINNINVALLQQQLPLFQYLEVDYRAWDYDKYWLGDFDEPKYLIIIPLVSQDDNWKYENGSVMVQTFEPKSESETRGGLEIEEEGKPPTDLVEKWLEAGTLKYIIDSSGIVYYAGSPFG